MNKSENYLEWMLLGIRMLVGITLIIYGIQSIVAQVNSPTPFEGSHWPGFLALLPIIAPILEIISGSLLTTGVLIELGAFLVIPVLFSSLLIIQLNATTPVTSWHFKYLLNLAMLAIAVGICGPGKWALWDPGKSLRQNIFDQN